MWLWWQSPGTTPPILDSLGAAKAGSIASLEKVVLDGTDQWVLLRGEDRRKPVLLVLHGGPGVAELLLFRKFLPELEKHFVVVNWDQLGAGKSYRADTPASRLTLQHFVSDTIELTQWLRQRFGQNKIYLLGHSWGSILGIRAAQSHPELYAAYIGVGQFVNFTRGERLSYEFALGTAKERGIDDAVFELESIGPPPYKEDADLQKTYTERKWVLRFGGDTRQETSYLFLAPVLLGGEEYTLGEKINFAKGIQRAQSILWPTLTDVDFFAQADTLRLPVYFCEGRHDHTVPSKLAWQYYERLQAPKKGWRWFENSAHNPHYEEPEAFVEYLTQTVLRETGL